MTLYYLKCSHITSVFAADPDTSKLWYIGQGIGTDLNLLTKYNEKCWDVKIINLDIKEEEFVKLMQSEDYTLQQ